MDEEYRKVSKLNFDQELVPSLGLTKRVLEIGLTKVKWKKRMKSTVRIRTYSPTRKLVLSL